MPNFSKLSLETTSGMWWSTVDHVLVPTIKILLFFFASEYVVSHMCVCIRCTIYDVRCTMHDGCHFMMMMNEMHVFFLLLLYYSSFMRIHFCESCGREQKEKNYWRKQKSKHSYSQNNECSLIKMSQIDINSHFFFPFICSMHEHAYRIRPYEHPCIYIVHEHVQFTSKRAYYSYFLFFFIAQTSFIVFVRWRSNRKIHQCRYG